MVRTAKSAPYLGNVGSGSVQDACVYRTVGNLVPQVIRRFLFVSGLAQVVSAQFSRFFDAILSSAGRSGLAQESIKPMMPSCARSLELWTGLRVVMVAGSFRDHRRRPLWLTRPIPGMRQAAARKRRILGLVIPKRIDRRRMAMTSASRLLPSRARAPGDRAAVRARATQTDKRRRAGLPSRLLHGHKLPFFDFSSR